MVGNSVGDVGAGDTDGLRLGIGDADGSWLGLEDAEGLGDTDGPWLGLEDALTVAAICARSLEVQKKQFGLSTVVSPSIMHALSAEGTQKQPFGVFD